MLHAVNSAGAEGRAGAGCPHCPNPSRPWAPGHDGAESSFLSAMSGFQKIVWVFSSALLLMWAVGYADGLTLVDNQQSDYSIVLAPNAIPAERFAAQELAAHIKQMSGADLKIIDDGGPLPKYAILLGRPRYLAELGVTPDWVQLGKEGYLIRTLGNHLIIAGGRPRGTMYGVYDLLHDHWGCRWYTFDTSHIPKKATLILPSVDVTQHPQLMYRDMMVPFSTGIDWYPHHWYAEYFTRNRWNNFMRWFDKRKPTRTRDMTYGGGYVNLTGPAHNYRWLVDPDGYGAEYPEYYALEDGKRLNYDIGGNQVELCLTNLGTVQAAAEYLLKKLRQYPDADEVFIGQSDTVHYCKCDNCAAARKKHGGWDSAKQKELVHGLPERYWEEYGGFAGWQLQFVNNVAELVTQEFPEVKVGTFAYLYARRPPRGIKAHPNVLIWYCPWGGPRMTSRCFCHSVDSGPANVDFDHFPSEMHEWKKIANHIYVYEYWLGCGFGQPVNIPTLQQTMRFYRKMGIEGISIDGIRFIPGGFEWLTYWLWGQLAWDPDFDVDKGVDEFCAAYYGAAAPYIKQYIRLACDPESYTEISRPDIYGRPRQNEPFPLTHTMRFTDDPYNPLLAEELKSCLLNERVMTKAAIDRGYELFEEARKAVADDPKSAKHVAYSRWPLEYAMLEWLPGTDPRLKHELLTMIETLQEMEIPIVGFNALTYNQYRKAVEKKIESGYALAPPEKARQKRESPFGLTSPAEAHYVDGKDCLELLPRLHVAATLPLHGWLFKADPEEVGVEKGYFKPACPVHDFSPIRVGKDWDAQGHPHLEQGWYRLEYQCPQLPEGKRVYLLFEAVDESAWLYIDGKLVAWYDTAHPQLSWDKPFLLEVTGNLKSRSEHLLALMVHNEIGAGGIYKPISVLVEK